MQPSISVIIPTYEDWDDLQACLNSLSAQVLSSEHYEIIVGNNNPQPAPPTNLELAANVRVVWQQKAGSYAARNAAVERSVGKLLCFTDADCRPCTDWLSNALALMDSQPDISRIGGEVQITSRDEQWTTPELYDRIFNLRQDRYVSRGYAATANLIVRRSLFESVGPFNDNLLSSGDKEWNRRASAHGSIIVHAKNVRVLHGARASFEAHAKKRSRLVQGRLTMRRKKGRVRLAKRFKLLLPSLPSAIRIGLFPSLSMRERFTLLAFDYKLRLHEYRTLSDLLSNDCPVGTNG